jgi:hypothetical protein
MASMTELGADFAQALADKDEGRLRDLVHPDVDFRGMTPNYSWEASSADELISLLLGKWFEDSDHIEALEHVETDGFADRDRVGYRFRVENPDGRFVVEQQAYLEPRDGKIAWMRVVCSGYRPLEP